MHTKHKTRLIQLAPLLPYTVLGMYRSGYDGCGSGSGSARNFALGKHRSGYMGLFALATAQWIYQGGVDMQGVFCHRKIMPPSLLWFRVPHFDPGSSLFFAPSLKPQSERIARHPSACGPVAWPGDWMRDEKEHRRRWIKGVSAGGWDSRYFKFLRRRWSFQV